MMFVNPIRTLAYSFFPGKAPIPPAESATSREVAVGEPITCEKIGFFYFKNPHMKWEHMQENKIIKACLEEWMLGRLYYLLLEANPDLPLEPLIEIVHEEFRFPFDVRDCFNVSVADLVLIAKKNCCEWQATVPSYQIGKAVIDSMQRAIFADPEENGVYEIRIPGRRKMGWNGKRFLGQRVINRPEYYSKENLALRKESAKETLSMKHARPSFAINEYPIESVASEHNTSTRDSRYTNTWPHVGALANYPNWSHAYGEEGRSGQDETTLKPSANQQYISEEVDYTAGEAWARNGDYFPALIVVTAGRPTGVVCFGKTTIWEIPCFWDMSFDINLTSGQKELLPLRVCSHLPRSRKDPGDTIRLSIEANGKVAFVE